MDNVKRPNHRPNKTLKVDDSPLLKDEYYTIYEIADILKVHHNTIRRAIKRGELKAIQIGRKWLVKKEDFIIQK